MSDFFNPGPSANSNDPGAYKANHDVNEHRLHNEGAPGLWRQVSNLLITVGIIAIIFVVFFWIL